MAPTGAGIRWRAREDSNLRPFLRREVLYPAELRALSAGSGSNHSPCRRLRQAESRLQILLVMLAGFALSVLICPVGKSVSGYQHVHSVIRPCLTCRTGIKTAIIVGAGLGGLAAALCLDRIGWRVVVLEQANALADVGAGIQISPNGVKVLRALGLEGAAAALACRPEAGQMRFGKSGRVIFTNPMTDYPSRYGAPYLHLHRADLVSVLAQALSERQPGALRTGAQVVTHQQDTGDVQVTLASGETVSGDVLIGADGLKSDVRAQMLGVAARGSPDMWHGGWLCRWTA